MCRALAGKRLPFPYSCSTCSDEPSRCYCFPPFPSNEMRLASFSKIATPLHNRFGASIQPCAIVEAWPLRAAVPCGKERVSGCTCSGAPLLEGPGRGSRVSESKQRVRIIETRIKLLSDDRRYFCRKQNEYQCCPMGARSASSGSVCPCSRRSALMYSHLISTYDQRCPGGELKARLQQEQPDACV